MVSGLSGQNGQIVRQQAVTILLGSNNVPGPVIHPCTEDWIVQVLLLRTSPMSWVLFNILSLKFMPTLTKIANFRMVRLESALGKMRWTW